MSLCEQVWKLSAICSIITITLQDECPANNYHPCECKKNANAMNLLCLNLVELPRISNMHFGSITLTNVKMPGRKFFGVTCSHLNLQSMQSDNVLSVQYLIEWKYESLQTQNTDLDLIKRLLRPIQNQLAHLDLNITENSWIISEAGRSKDKSYLSHLVNLASLTIRSTKVTLESNCFNKNYNMERLTLSGVIRELEDNSLVFHSRKAMIIDLSDNGLKLDDLRKSKLTNDPVGFNTIDLRNNNLEYLDKELFLPFIKENNNVIINLEGNNYIECNCHDTSWVFDNFYVSGNLKNIKCYNHGGSNLFKLTKEGLCSKTTASSITDYTFVTNSWSTLQQISTTESSSTISTTIEEDVTQENEPDRDYFKFSIITSSITDYPIVIHSKTTKGQNSFLSTKPSVIISTIMQENITEENELDRDFNHVKLGMLWWHIVLIILAFIILLSIMIYSVMKLKINRNNHDQNNSQGQNERESFYIEETFNIENIELPSSSSPRSSVARHHYDSISGIIDNYSGFTMMSEPKSIDRQSDLSIIPFDEL